MYDVGQLLLFNIIPLNDMFSVRQSCYNNTEQFPFYKITFL